MTLTHPTLKLTLAAALVAGVSAPTLATENDLSPLWFSLDIGAASALTQEDYQDQTDDAGFDEVTVSASDTARLAWRLGAGWDFRRPPDSPFTLATQVEWFNLGEVDLSYSGSVPNSELEALYDELESIHPESGSGIAWGLSGQWRGFEQRRLQRLALGAELGATYWWQSYELDDVNGEVARTDETSGAGWYGGLLADYQLAPQWTTRAGWRVYGLDNETVQTITLGLTYNPNRRRADEAPLAADPDAVPAPETLLTPLGRPDQFSLDQAGTGQFDVLANDSDPNGEPLHLVWVAGSQAGQLQITDDRQAVVYRHDGSDQTSDGFRYWFSAGETEMGPVNVSLSIMRTRPEPRSDRFTVMADVVVQLDVLANDSDPNNSSLFISQINVPGNGRLELINGILVYLVEEGSGVTETSFEYWVSNGRLEAGPVRVELIVK